MKIAVLTPYWSETTGGISRYVQELVRAYSLAGHEVTVLTNGRAGLDTPAVTCSSGVEVLSSLCSVHPDIIHVHSKMSFIIPSIFYRVFYRRVKVGFTFHTQPSAGPYLPISKPEPPDYAGFKRVVAQELLNMCDVVTAVSGSLFNNLASYCGIKVRRQIVVPGGCEIKTAGIDARAAKPIFNVEECYPVLSTTGVLAWDWKVAGHKLCIEALSSILDVYPKAVLLIAGGGDTVYRDYLEAIVRERRLESRVRFLGTIRNVHEMIECSDVYVHMALNEACPVAVLEAMAHGKPIVAARSGGIPELIESGVTGLVVDPVPTSVAEAVVRIVSDSRLARDLGSAAAARVATRHSWQRIAKVYLDAFRGV